MRGSYIGRSPRFKSKFHTVLAVLEAKTKNTYTRKVDVPTTEYQPAAPLLSRQPYVSCNAFGQVTMALLDQGCLPANLMSIQYFERIRQLIPTECTVEAYTAQYGVASKSGPGITATHRITIPVTLSEHKLSHKVTLTFVVCNCGRDVMLGWEYVHTVGYEFNSLVVKKHHLLWRETEARLNAAMADNGVNIVSLPDKEEILLAQDYQGFNKGKVYASPITNKNSAPEENLIPERNFAEKDIVAIGSMASDFDKRCQNYQDTIMNQVDPQYAAAVPELEAYLRDPITMGRFIPKVWEGIKDPKTGEPWITTLEWLQLPTGRHVRCIRVRPDLVIVAKAEVEHLVKIGFWVLSDSHVASSMLVAPKATDPFIRLVTDYAWLTPNLSVPKHPLKHVKDSLNFFTGGDQITGDPFGLYDDLDMLAGYHQFGIDKPSSELLSVVTPWAQYRPRFLPEGIAPASAILQCHVDRIFAKHEKRMLCIYDNLLLAGTSYRDLFEQFKGVINTCVANNVYLKHTKCHFGTKQVKFFGYVCSSKKYYLDDHRVQGITDMLFPADVATTVKGKVKAMQSYLGMCQFFAGFIPNYAEHSAPLTDMIHQSYDWKNAESQRAVWEAHKKLIAKSFDIYFPNYNWKWFLRVDASKLGLGGMLCQLNPDTNQLEPLQIMSMKFSEQASRWHCMHQEAFSIMWCTLKAEVLLRGKSFTMETDHRNLIWMSKSTDAKIVRMCEALRPFDFDVKHIPGKLNIIADVVSRMFPDAAQDEIDSATVDCVDHLNEVLLAHDEIETIDSDDSMLQDAGIVAGVIDNVHGGRMGHHGILRTWALLNKHFPGHSYSVQQVADHISQCVTCQKFRLDSDSRKIDPLVKRINSDHHRHKYAIDGTMVLKDGSNILIVYNLFTKLVSLYRMPDKTALSAARAIFSHFATFGTCEIIHSDLGSDFNSATVNEFLNAWCGIRQTFALQRNPQADGVEPEVKQVLKHLSCLVFDSGIEADYSKVENLMLIQLIINEVPHSQTSVIPLDATFGDFTTIPPMPTNACSHSYVAQLGSNLATLRAKSAAYRAKLHKAISEPQPPNKFQKGDFVLYKLHKSEKASKLRAIYRGPYVVVSHPKDSNHVEVRQLTHNLAYFKFDVKDLSIFIGNAQQATEAANKDDDQHYIKSIISFRGDVTQRSRMEFLVQFLDGDTLWTTYSPDLSTTTAFENFCTSSRYKALQMLLLSVKLLNNSISALNKSSLNISELYEHGVFINLRSYGGDWYDGLTSLPDKDVVNYYVRCSVSWNGGKRSSKGYSLHCPVFNQVSTHDSAYLHYYGNVTSLLPGEVEITPELCSEYRLFN